MLRFIRRIALDILSGGGLFWGVLFWATVQLGFIPSEDMVLRQIWDHRGDPTLQVFVGTLAACAITVGVATDILQRKLEEAHPKG